MAQFKPFVLNVQAPDQRPAARYPRQFSTGDLDSTPFDGSGPLKESRESTCRYISGLIMFLIIAVALAVVCSQNEGQFSFCTPFNGSGPLKDTPFDGSGPLKESRPSLQ